MSSRNAIHAAKKLLRKELKGKLVAMTETEKTQQSNDITKKLLATSEYQNSSRISVFLSMSDEVNTSEVLTDIFQSGKTCYIPRYYGDKMDMVLLTSPQDYDSLPLTKWNIKQPDVDDVRENALDSGGLDLILMPGLGFTRCGKRLGRGKGYYDTFLFKYRHQFNTLPYTIALAYTQQICEDIPTSELDVPIGKVLTPNEQ